MKPRAARPEATEAPLALSLTATTVPHGAHSSRISSTVKSNGKLRKCTTCRARLRELCRVGCSWQPPLAAATVQRRRGPACQR